MSIIRNITRIPFISNFTHLSMIQVSNAIIQLLLFPIIIRVIGMEAFGTVSVALAYATIMGILVNYGTSLSGVKEMATTSNSQQRSVVYTETIALRLMVLMIPFICLLFTPLLEAKYQQLFIFSTPLIVAEVLNPLCFYTGLQKILPHNIANLLSKLLAAAAILLGIQQPSDAYLVNCILGTSSLISYLCLHIYLHKQWQIQWVGIQWKKVIKLLKQNLPLAGNNLTAQVQQSLLIFFLSGYSSSVILGAYAVCDKIVWSFRLFIIAFASAVFPEAVRQFQLNPTHARKMKKHLNQLFAVLFTIIGTAIAVWPEPLVWLVTGQQDETTILFVRLISFVPLVAALNAFNVIELLVRDKYQQLFKAGLCLMIAALILSIVLIQSTNIVLWGLYPLAIEIISLCIYLFFLSNLKKIYDTNA